MAKKRTIKSIFTIREDDNNAGVHFLVGNKLIGWEDLTRTEQVKTLNAWAGMFQLFSRHIKEEEK